MELEIERLYMKGAGTLKEQDMKMDMIEEMINEITKVIEGLHNIRRMQIEENGNCSKAVDSSLNVYVDMLRAYNKKAEKMGIVNNG